MKLFKSALRALATNELIGLEAKVTKASDPGVEGKAGKIVDETQNTIEIRCGKKDVVLDKRSITLAIMFPQGEFEIPGREMLQRPEERLKKLWTKVK